MSTLSSRIAAFKLERHLVDWEWLFEMKANRHAAYILKQIRSKHPSILRSADNWNNLRNSWDDFYGRIQTEAPCSGSVWPRNPSIYLAQFR